MARVRTVAGVVILIVAFALSAAAQGTGDIVGRVTDSSGAILPGVTVTATSLATNFSRTTVTSDTGDYAFELLPIGVYEVKTELAGFKSQMSRVTLATGDRARVDVRLDVGAVAENVTVTAQAALLQTDTSQVSSRLTPETVQNAPISGRNIINIVQLTPGASEGAATATISGNRPDDRRQTSAVSINGNPENDNLQLVDGLDNTERVMGGMGIKPSIDAIQEVVVQTNLYSAENGRTLGGVVNIITKAGGNQFHGSGFYYLRNEHFDAKDYFAVTKPLNHLNQFGGSLGGPLKSDRTFFFADYDQGRITKDQAFVVTVPTVMMHSGNFSELSVPIYDPTTRVRMPFAGNVIPANRLDPVAMKLMSLYPMPNQPGLANNFAYNGEGWQTNQATDIRIDHHLTAKDSLFARYSYNLTDGLTPSQCPATTIGDRSVDPTCNTNGTAGIYSGPYHTFAHNLVVNWLRVPSPTLITEVKYNFVRPLTSASRPSANSADLAAYLGFNNVNYASDPITGGLPWFEMRPTSYAAIGDPTFIPMETEDHNHQIAGSLTKIKGAHSIKVGGGVVFRMFAVQQSQYPRGLFAFDSSVTSNGAGGGGNTFASFLLGLPSVEQRIHFPIHPRNRSTEPSVFVQDDWRATSWLTLNLGLRYEIYTPITEADNQMSAFRPELGKIIVASNSDPTVGVKTDYTDIGPRLGFSATAPHRIVLRGGFGMTYTPVLRGAGSFLKNPPFTENYGPFNSAATSGGLPNLFLSDVPPPLTFNDPTQPAGQVTQQVTDYKSARSKQYNLFIEKELGGNVVSLGYVGSRSDRVPLTQNINLPTPGPGSVQARRPWYSQYPSLTNINMITNRGERTYDAAQGLVQRRYSNGLHFSTHYTWAHARQSGFAPWDNTILEWGDIPTYDIRHHWVGIVGYELPWGKGLQGVAHGFLAGWQANVVGNYSSGIAFTIVNASPQTNVGGSDRPNVVGNPELPADQRTLQHWFNTSAFALQAPYTAGDVGVGTMHGPPQRRVDLSLNKLLRPSSFGNVQVRIEMYNITNTPSFQPPDPNFGSTTFGSISSTGNAIPRQMQFAVKYLF
ncbi:MAG TPA: carboxypeptidase regulatory-like domain-containing protein [Vicinamibacterales bacterium]|nr:carboxypeptidase regulatory-like domain-containing protein [Vicinamibacterales bacterium]